MILNMNDIWLKLPYLVPKSPSIGVTKSYVPEVPGAGQIMDGHSALPYGHLFGNFTTATDDVDNEPSDLLQTLHQTYSNALYAPLYPVGVLWILSNHDKLHVTTPS